MPNFGSDSWKNVRIVYADFSFSRDRTSPRLRRGPLSVHSAITPQTIVGAMYLVGGSVSPPITMVPLLLSNNPLTRAKYASVGARAKSPFEGHRGKIPGPKFTVGRPGQVTPTNQIAGPHLLHRSNECPFAHSGAVQVYQSVIVPGLGNAEEVIHLAGC